MASIMGKGLPHFPAEGARGRINCAAQLRMRNESCPFFEQTFASAQKFTHG
ncbi:hypothetical protein [Sphingomonas sp. NIBR02145]|jgi:hypothetical protein|uniref:hypothetical protein n=1 Tax=Sphingomonas sp. NIBR02145 TaxID=3014784 RepID=UPI0022B4F965|nr:hypothetical protein [Sphingomonas sp. NIBR02145]WHU01488.1 hypothetical protein O3305_14920 [Sphingomonas sp. NIBR02145]